ncbi:4-hydroxy-tetrahydrodipicolinate synthase [Flavobacteriaceae bacterium]|jgi:4-hydroxy-tetrahydrodipicolinate synthase|nr:4-hydroxy-tetrahydrodipicolinate synthase [Flavobacteriaceae bacterium]MDA9849183.1 4-hydroxy-tetrahydrodipicolinate synthase [Flavobacteriaceae bacterium]
MINNKFIGTGVALITPFNSDFSVDYSSLEKLVEYNILNGIDYLVINGTTAESPTINSIERDKIINTVVNVNNNRVPLVLGMGCNDTLRLVKEINSLNLQDISAILSVSPYYNKPTQEGIYEHYTYLAKNISKPIIMYNVPGRTSRNMVPNTILRLANEFESIIGVKEAGGDINQYLELIKNKPDNFLIISGDDDLALSSVISGGHGVISVIAQAFPKMFSKMINDALNNKHSIAKSTNDDLFKIISLIFKENNPAGIKYVLNKLNLCNDVLRLPLMSVSKELRSQINEELNNFNL